MSFNTDYRVVIAVDATMSKYERNLALIKAQGLYLKYDRPGVEVVCVLFAEQAQLCIQGQPFRKENLGALDQRKWSNLSDRFNLMLKRRYIVTRFFVLTNAESLNMSLKPVGHFLDLTVIKP